MSTSKRDLEAALQNALYREKLLETKLRDREHVLNLLVNGCFDKFHIALTENGAVHDFSIGVAHNVEIEEVSALLAQPGRTTEDRRFVLWKTEFKPGHIFACGYSEHEFLAIPAQLNDEAAEIRSLIQDTIKKIPPKMPFLVDKQTGQASS